MREDFKKQMREDFIPRMERMLAEEKKHLAWLIKKRQFILAERSEEYIKHLSQRINEYNHFVDINKMAGNNTNHE